MADSVLIATPQIVYVAIASRAEFDKLDVPLVDHAEHPMAKKVLVKRVSQGSVMVIFQHWLQ